jgi:hypothetical protein
MRSKVRKSKNRKSRTRSKNRKSRTRSENRDLKLKNPEHLEYIFFDKKVKKGEIVVRMQKNYDLPLK